MIQLPHGTDLALESGQRFLARAPRIGQQFDGDLFSQRAMPSQVNRSHPASTQRMDQLIDAQISCGRRNPRFTWTGLGIHEAFDASHSFAQKRIVFRCQCRYRCCFTPPTSIANRFEQGVRITFEFGDRLFTRGTCRQMLFNFRRLLGINPPGQILFQRIAWHALGGVHVEYSAGGL